MASKDEPRERKKASKPLPTVLLWCILFTIAWSGVFGVYFVAGIVETSQMLIALSDNQVAGEVRVIEFTRGATITLLVFYSLLFIATLLTFLGGFGLLRNRAFGINLALFGPGTAALLGFAGVGTEIFLVRGARLFMVHLLGFLLTSVLSLALCIFNFYVLNNGKNTRGLR